MGLWLHKIGLQKGNTTGIKRGTNKSGFGATADHKTEARETRTGLHVWSDFNDVQQLSIKVATAEYNIILL